MSPRYAKDAIPAFSCHLVPLSPPRLAFQSYRCRTSCIGKKFELTLRSACTIEIVPSRFLMPKRVRLLHPVL
ncbi:hypothetical protein BcDW1_9851 [Botrytis cinerea BcDW1]|uniref:Uncharacterized protein n=1 Tax=Botryotinia fuckeliana (strain BcDW1) TaxID=1290391 RepID=M7U4G8_BOTF1|nr:hypothetical protein BcDW1_9851 [Botrytis cinerea BcDW1]